MEHHLLTDAVLLAWFVYVTHDIGETLKMLHGYVKGSCTAMSVACVFKILIWLYSAAHMGDVTYVRQLMDTYL